MTEKAPKEKPATLLSHTASKLKHLRETVRKMSPEELEKRIADLGGKVSASYIRRIEKDEHSPTIETLEWILRALDSNPGLFFEDLIEESTDISAKHRRYQRIVQRALESPCQLEATALINLLQRALNPTIPGTPDPDPKPRKSPTHIGAWS